MLRVEPGYFVPVESQLLRFLYEQFFAPIIQVVDIPMPKLNANSVLLAAIRSGRVQYADGVFRGSFNARISGELSSFAEFDRRSGIWRGDAPAAIKGAAIVAESKRAELMGRLEYAIDQTSANIQDAISGLTLGDELPIPMMSADIKADLAGYSIGVMPEITPQLEKKLRRDYTESQQLNIKNWAPEQTERLREMVQRIQTTGDNSSIRVLIQSEWGTTASKARFLARQETSLFFSKLSLNRADSAGVRKYKWSTSHDERVRQSHKHLQGVIVPLDSPPVVDPKTGRRAHAGEDFNCRCAKIWVLD